MTDNFFNPLQGLNQIQPSLIPKQFQPPQISSPSTCQY